LNSCAATMPSDIVFSEGGGEDPRACPQLSQMTAAVRRTAARKLRAVLS
jgi:hypothetical protein